MISLSDSSTRRLALEAISRGLPIPEEIRRRFPDLQLATAPTTDLSLADFFAATVNYEVDPWQRILCERLQRLATETGQRILIHAPPQAGKSVIVSQRFPAWLLAQRPTERIKLACYNITRAERFGRIVRDLMQSGQYARLFPDEGLRLPKLAGAGEWSTAARRSLRDAQPSFKALGLQTGFVGEGADTLIIDDPYASPQDAASEVIRESVWTFWSESARVRLNDATNVVVMFHRYHEDDLAGRMWAEGGWEMLRFAAEWDADAEYPADPLGRSVGERLSPRWSDEYLAAQQANQITWLTQFQGRPTAREGAFFKVGKLQYCDAVEAPRMVQSVRAWDMAATERAGNYTAGVRMGRDVKGRFYVQDVTRGQWGTDRRNERIRDTAESDGKLVSIRGPQDPGAAGVEAAASFIRNLAGFAVTCHRVSGDKSSRADGFSAQVNGGNVTLIRGDWNAAFVEELRAFPVGRFDDQVDAAADAFNILAAGAPQSYPVSGQRAGLLPPQPGIRTNAGSGLRTGAR